MPLLLNCVTNLRACPLRVGEVTMLVDPLALPLAAVSCVAVQLDSVWTLLTDRAPEGAEVPLLPLLVVEPPLTEMATLLAHPAPWLPHDFTCSVCAPLLAVTCVFTEVPLMMVVSELLSSE